MAMAWGAGSTPFMMSACIVKGVRFSIPAASSM